MRAASNVSHVPTSTYRRRGAAAMEYIAILVFIVLPIGLMLPMFMDMIKTYGLRLMAVLSSPYP